MTLAGLAAAPRRRRQYPARLPPHGRERDRVESGSGNTSRARPSRRRTAGRDSKAVASSCRAERTPAGLGSRVFPVWLRGGPARKPSISLCTPRPHSERAGPQAGRANPHSAWLTSRWFSVQRSAMGLAADARYRPLAREPCRQRRRRDALAVRLETHCDETGVEEIESEHGGRVVEPPSGALEDALEITIIP